MFRWLLVFVLIIAISGPSAAQDQGAKMGVESTPVRLEGPARAWDGDTI